MTSRPLRIGVVAGEHSGDILGAKVVCKLRERHPDLEIYGIGGVRMISEGVESIFPMERLSVMGIIEPLARLPELLSIRAKLFRYFQKRVPDVFLGIDSPDFNLALEGKLKKTGMPVAHIVSPSVWAWRPGRVKKVNRCIDRLFCLLPFEPDYYSSCETKAEFVGHPLADELADLKLREEVRSHLGLHEKELVVAVLPGSRMSEVRILADIFFKSLQIIKSTHSPIQFLVPAVDDQIFDYISQKLKAYPSLKVRLLNGQSREAMLASNCVLLASGTATLEAALMLRPMVVAYKMTTVSWAILSRMAATKFVSLPNILVNKSIVPEFLQKNATPELLANALIQILDNGNDFQTDVFLALKNQLGRDCSTRCANAIEEMFLVEKITPYETD